MAIDFSKILDKTSSSNTSVQSGGSVVQKTSNQSAAQVGSNKDNNTIETLCSQIYSSTAGRLGTDEKSVFDIVNNSDKETLVKIMDSYSSVTGSELFKDIQNDFSIKDEQIIISELEDAYYSITGKSYTGDDDGLLNNKQKLKSIGNALKDKTESIASTAAICATPAVFSAIASSSVGTAIATSIGGTALAGVLAAAAPVLAVVGIVGTAVGVGYGIYKAATGISDTIKSAEKYKNAKTDDEATKFYEQGTEGVIDTATGTVLAFQSGKELYNSVNALKNITSKTPKITEKSFTKGEFGYQCSQSKPLEEFSTVMTDDIMQNGVATPRLAGDTYLKGSIHQPLATQDVHNCSYISLSNSQTETQAIYHVLPSGDIDEMKQVINLIMPEGFDNVTIVPGDATGTEKTTAAIYKAVTSINDSIEVNFAHMNSKIPAIVSYNGQVYQTPNIGTSTLFGVPEDFALSNVVGLLYPKK